MSRLARTPVNVLAASADPSTPTSRAGDVYFNSALGLLRAYTGTVWVNANTANDEVFSFAAGSTDLVSPQVGKARIYLEADCVLTTVRIAVGTAVVTTAYKVDVNKNGTTVYTTQGNRPTIAVAGYTGTGNSPDVTAFTAGDYVTVDFDQGTVPAGEVLTVTLRFGATGGVSGGGGGASLDTVQSKTTTYTALAADFVKADASSAGFTVTLPTAPTSGSTVTVMKTDSGANLVTVVGAGATTINGDSSVTVAEQYAGATFLFDGTNWLIKSVM